MRRFLNRIKDSVPKPIKQFGDRIYNYLPLEVKYGSEYRRTLDFLTESQNWTRTKHKDFQVKMLRDLVQHAVTHVPFYRDLYSREGIESREIRSIEDIRHLPMVSKDDLRLHRERIKAENYPASAFQYHTTGGSTAKPVGLYWEADRTVPMEKAFTKRQFDWIGYDMERDRVANIRGIPLSKGKHSEIVAGKQLRLSSYRMTPSVLDEYVDLINNFQPKVLHAYPSSALILARHLLEHRLSLPSIRIVLCGSEQLFDWHRVILNEAYQCRIYSWYGQSEYVALAGECEHSTEYHFYSEYGVTEILKKNGEPAHPGETGEIVATGFLNFAFPLIRYRMEDLATVSMQDVCECGRPYKRVEKIEGRIQEMIVSKNGNLISMTAINMHDDVFDSIHQFQFYQDTPGYVTLRIVPKRHHTASNEAKILRSLQQKTGDQITIVIKQVDQIEQTPRGKTRFLVQKLPLGNDWDR